MSSPQTLIVSKSDFTRHATVTVDESSLPPLSPSSARIRPVVLTIGKNMLFYVRRNPFVDWWPAFPLPSGTSVPSGPADDWCVSKSWGYAEVVDSTTEGLSKGTFIMGWLPVSSAHHDLKLKPFGGPGSEGHYLETSEERSRMFKLANHYYVAPEPPNAWKISISMTWGISHLLSRFSFPEDNDKPGALAPVFPTGNGNGAWTNDDADLASTVVVGLSTSSKCGRSFTYNFTTRSANKPLAYLQVSSSAAQAEEGKPSSDNTRKVDYESVSAQETLDWIAGFRPARILVVDFGARGSVLPQFLEKASFTLSRVNSALKEITLVMVGTPPQIRSDPGLPKTVADGVAFRMIMTSHDAIQDYGEQHLGAEDVRRAWHDGFDQWTREGWGEGMKLVEGKGVEASEEAYGKIARGEHLPPQEAWAYWM